MNLEAEVLGLGGHGVSNSLTADVLTSSLAGPECADQLRGGGGVWGEGWDHGGWGHGLDAFGEAQAQAAMLSGHRPEIHDDHPGRAWRVQPGGLSLTVLHLHRGAPAHSPQVGGLAGEAVGRG